jgi:hypothetical protein
VSDCQLFKEELAPEELYATENTRINEHFYFAFLRYITFGLGGMISSVTEYN